MADDLPPWVTEGLPDDPSGPIGPIFVPPPGASAVYDYTDADGFPRFKVVRFEANGSGKKRFLQFSLEGQEWVPRQTIPAGERPLFGLPILQQYFGASVLVVEGEKTALAAREIVPADWVVTTWAGGSSAPLTADWSILEQRDVLIWPDNDAPGLKAAKSILGRLPQARIVDVPLDFPDGWDLADPPPTGWDHHRLMGWLRADATNLGNVPPKNVQIANGQSRPVIDPLSWHGLAVPLRRWIIDDILPYHVVTMLSGDGGLGKSTLALQTAVIAATGQDWFGRKVAAIKVLIVACEDDQDELHRRLYDICTHLNVGFEDLENIRIIPGAGYDNVLVDFDDFANHGRRTEFCEFVEAQAKDFGAQLIILDSLHDFFAGNENARPQARQFINHLRRIAMERDGAVLLLAHPSLSGLRDKTGNSGSTAWNNTVRSRLYLYRPEDAQHLILKTMKANYSANGGEIRLEYRKGCFYNLDAANTAAPIYQQLNAEDTFIKCLRAANKQYRRVTASKYGSYAPKVFAAMKEINRYFTQADFERAMLKLYDLGRLTNGPVKDSTGHIREGIVEVAEPTISDDGVPDEL